MSSTTLSVWKLLGATLKYNGCAVRSSIHNRLCGGAALPLLHWFATSVGTYAVPTTSRCTFYTLRDPPVRNMPYSLIHIAHE